MSKKINISSPHYKALADIELNTKNRNQTAQEDGQKAAAKARAKGEKYTGEHK